MAVQKHRLVTRSDFEGLVCGMLLRELDLIDEIKFVHPKDMQDGIVPITARDVMTNLPYTSRVATSPSTTTPARSRAGAIAAIPTT